MKHPRELFSAASIAALPANTRTHSLNPNAVRSMVSLGALLRAYRRMAFAAALTSVCSGLVGCASAPAKGITAPVAASQSRAITGTTQVTDTSAARQAVMATERAFAKTMADRDKGAFASFIADEAVFFSGAVPLRGKQQVVDAWARFFSAPSAPFSWEPDEVEVLDSGALALSSGPVYDAKGKLIARFASIWRRTPAHTLAHTIPSADADTWQIVFDKGSDVCDCKTP